MLFACFVLFAQIQFNVQAILTCSSSFGDICFLDVRLRYNIQVWPLYWLSLLCGVCVCVSGGVCVNVGWEEKHSGKKRRERRGRAEKEKCEEETEDEKRAYEETRCEGNITGEGSKSCWRFIMCNNLLSFGILEDVVD